MGLIKLFSGNEILALSLQEKIEKNIKIAIAQLGIPETQARKMATSILPIVERWRK